MHLHGHHLLVLSRDGVAATGSPWWVDSQRATARTAKWPSWRTTRASGWTMPQSAARQGGPHDPPHLRGGEHPVPPRPRFRQRAGVAGYPAAMTGAHGTTAPLGPALAVTHADFLASRPVGADEDVHMIPAVVDHIIERCSAPGDLVFDPFAGSAHLECVALERRAMGIELLPAGRGHPGARPGRRSLRATPGRCCGRRSRPAQPAPGEVDRSHLPPYMTGRTTTPSLTAYEETDGDCTRYLRELARRRAVPRC